MKGKKTMWMKKVQTKSNKKNLNDLVINDTIRLEFLSWLGENNYLLLSGNQEDIWIHYISNRDKQNDSI